jgi:hypothetical protein
MFKEAKNTKVSLRVAKATKKTKLTKKVKKPLTRPTKRTMSTILTGNEGSALPSNSNQEKSINHSAAPEQIQQHQEPIKIDFDDPNVAYYVGVWNSFIRAKTCPPFQQAFQNFLVTKKVIPYPTTQDFKNPVQHIRRGLLAHGLIMEENDERALPENIIKLQNEARSKNKEEGGAISTDSLYHLLDFFQIFNPTDENDPAAHTRYKPGLSNQFIPHKPGVYETDPTNFDHGAIQKKIDANKRLGIDASLIKGNSVLDIVGFCAEAAGGLDLREYAVTDNRPSSHAIFTQYLRKLPPPGDLFTSNFGKNSAFPFSPAHLQLFPNLTPALTQVSQAVDSEKSPQELLKFSLRVSRRDVFKIWSTQNSDLSSRFLQCGLNPLISFNGEELGSIKGMILKQFLQNMLVNQYLFEPFQNTLYNVNLANNSPDEELAEYYKKRNDAIADINENDSEEEKTRKTQLQYPDTAALSILTRLTENQNFIHIKSQIKRHLLIQNIPKNQYESLTTKLHMTLMQQGLIDHEKFAAEIKARFPDSDPNFSTFDDQVLFDFSCEQILDSLSQAGVLTKKKPTNTINNDSSETAKTDETSPKVQITPTGREIIPFPWGASIPDDVKAQISPETLTVGVIDPKTKEIRRIKTFEQEICARLIRFGVLNSRNMTNYEINTLSPLISPEDTPEDKEFKDFIVQNKLLPISSAALPPSVLHQQIQPRSQLQKMPLFTRLLSSIGLVELTAGDFDPQSPNSVPLSAEELLHLRDEELIQTPEGANIEGVGKIVQIRQKAQELLDAGIDPESQLQLDHDLADLQVIARSLENTEYPMHGWERNLENDKALASGALLDIDNALFKMDLRQLRQFVSREFNGEVGMAFAQQNDNTFTIFTRDMHTNELPQDDMNNMRFMASQMVTQSLLKAQFRETQNNIDKGIAKIEDLAYHHVLFTTPEQSKASKEYFLDTSRFESKM